MPLDQRNIFSPFSIVLNVELLGANQNNMEASDLLQKTTDTDETPAVLLVIFLISSFMLSTYFI